MDERIQRLLDEAEIRDLLLEFARALDERDWTSYANTFTKDGVFEIFDQRRVGHAEIARGPSRDLIRFDRTQHFISNQTVTVDDDQATAKGYLLAVHIPDSTDPARHADVGGVYHCQCRRTGEGWKFSHVRTEILWFAGIPYVGDLPADDKAESVSSTGGPR